MSKVHNKNNQDVDPENITEDEKSIQDKNKAQDLKQNQNNKADKDNESEHLADDEKNKTADEDKEVYENDKESELQSIKKELEEKNDQILRLSAEIKNIQRRNNKERQDAAKYRSQHLAEKLLGAVDNLERALTIEADDEASRSMKRGIEMVLESIQSAFNDEEIKTIDPKGEKFDPNFHQSVSSVPADDGQESDTIVEVYQKGYVIKDRVLRPAMVVVAQ
ncbi:nucleotide exchange factor GrpE [Aerococcus mictus]|uniref:nucleotide exchange factor GrpE n=1 Tax=Aerococcus mictus TaxID=2976810 RepID=UPI0018E0F5F7|nr:nucleotide exchange factor GrpE [Aerococcus mictus]